ncbi:MAG TPA: Rieske 2Fe-2S domain-containing protein [Candidatus Binatia bacterium]|jgi:phenylpropionate dioxygenase-like ring-hydroxylating dioxygenase large terminal subunit
MLSREENELLTRTDAGTPMGELMRRYWLPALLSSEIPEPDCPPARIKILGEQLVAFRDSEGRIGLLDEFCAHRGTSLWLGRNEQSGLRCVWHGWKYDVNGQCIHQLNEQPETSFAQKIRIKSYPTCELGGVIWAYLGPPEKKPPLPQFAWTQVPETHRHASKVIQECNWLQALEGGLDQSHVGILHSTFRANSNVLGSTPESFNARGGAPVFDIEPTQFGHRYVAIRTLPDRQQYVRGYNFVMPFTQIRPYSPKGTADASKKFNPGHMWVPIDDENCVVWNWMYSWGEEPLREEDRLDRSLANGPNDVDQKTFRSFRNKSNEWLIDRDMQRKENFTGILGVNTQDRAVQELQGPIADRTREHLGPADRAIIIARQMLLEAVKTVQAGGDPPGADASYYRARATVKIIPPEASWREAILSDMYPSEL